MFFGGVAVLQLGHLGEHGAQVSQLIMSGGTLEDSRGVVGRLDFEAVHFFWDTAIWLTTMTLLWRFGIGNAWIWVSLFFASLHQVEHIYLYYINLFEPEFYSDRGGFAGLLGHGGALPTIERPYLHFTYNFMVVIPFTIAFLKQVEPVLRAPELRRPARRDVASA
jgi:hypothetical protein